MRCISCDCISSATGSEVVPACSTWIGAPSSSCSPISGVVCRQAAQAARRSVADIFTSAANSAMSSVPSPSCRCCAK